MSRKRNNGKKYVQTSAKFTVRGLCSRIIHFKGDRGQYNERCRVQFDEVWLRNYTWERVASLRIGNIGFWKHRPCSTVSFPFQLSFSTRCNLSITSSFEKESGPGRRCQLSLAPSLLATPIFKSRPLMRNDWLNNKFKILCVVYHFGTEKFDFVCRIALTKTSAYKMLFYFIQTCLGFRIPLQLVILHRKNFIINIVGIIGPQGPVPAVYKRIFQGHLWWRGRSQVFTCTGKENSALW